MKPPLALYVLWHPKFEAGARYANAIYSNFTRDIHQPLSRGIGIPVYFRSEPFEGGLPSPINLDEYQRSVVVVLVDDHIVVSPPWHGYIDGLNEPLDSSGGNHLLLPVAVTQYAFNLQGLADINAIQLYEVEDDTHKTRYLIDSLTHELCRLLYNRERTERSPSPLKLFLSHAKADGEALAEQIRDYVRHHTVLETFFDTNDIADGYRFSEELEASIKQSALLVIHSDRYSSREWCRREILTAKRNRRPILVVNVFDEGEDRSFPYLANVPHIRCAESMEPDTMMQRILTETLRESLRFKYHALYLRHLIEEFRVAGISDEAVLPHPPELLTFVNLKGLETKRVVYPDPPLGDEELELLKEFDSEMEFLTPTLLPVLAS